MKLFLPTAENEKAHNLWIKLTFTKCQCQLDRQGWLEKIHVQVYKNTKFILVLSLFAAFNGREHRTNRNIRGVTFSVVYVSYFFATTKNRRLGQAFKSTLMSPILLALTLNP